MANNKTAALMFPSCSLRAAYLLVIATIFLAAVCAKAGGPAGKSRAAVERSATATGIDVLEQEGFTPLRGKRIAIITNQTGVDSQGRRTIDVLANAPGVRLFAIFSPEHGIAGKIDANVPDSADAATHLPIYSLYGATRRPTPEMLRGLDSLVYDIQDAGVRFYTYITTMGYCMEAAAQNHEAFYVLDRPDPLGGEVIEGPMLDPDKISFTAYFPLPVRYAMTPGELAQMLNAEKHLGLDLHVIPMKNWRRSETFSDTGLPFIPPSPNLRNVNAAFLYPGVEILQAGGVSVGRGTGAPFELLGAPWIRGGELAAELNRQKIPGVEFSPARFTPTDALYKGKPCEGVSLTLTDPVDFRSMTMGLEIAAALRRLYPDSFHAEKTIELLGSQETVDELVRGMPVAQIVAGWSDALDQFRAMRSKYLLYN